VHHDGDAHDHDDHVPNAGSLKKSDSVGHGHQHDHSNASESALKFALGLTGSVMLLEVFGGFWFRSLALLSDAMHMATDAFAIALALVAIHLGKRAPDRKRTFGYARFEILAAAVNAALLIGVGAYILWEAILRLRRPEQVHTSGMLLIAVIGLIVNVIAVRLLAATQAHSLNV
jgi:cobalt-zinc-cadmium efflux system protein